MLVKHVSIACMLCFVSTAAAVMILGPTSHAMQYLQVLDMF